MGEGLHKAWWKSRYEDDPATKTRAKLELFALCTDPSVPRKVEATAQETVQEWLKSHRVAIKSLPEGSQQAYNEVRKLAADPELTPLGYPTTIEEKKAGEGWRKHLYVDKGWMYSAKLNKWETKVVEEELGKEGLVGWLRNPPRKSWSLCIPYILSGEQRALYPDFLFVRLDSGELVVDLLDPHRMDLEDAPAKAAGLARYADKHSQEFGRIELIIVEGEEIRRLNLTDERVRNKVRGVSNHAHLRQLYESATTG